MKKLVFISFVLVYLSCSVNREMKQIRNQFTLSAHDKIIFQKKIYYKGLSATSYFIDKVHPGLYIAYKYKRSIFIPEYPLSVELNIHYSDSILNILHAPDSAKSYIFSFIKKELSVNDSMRF